MRKIIALAFLISGFLTLSLSAQTITRMVTNNLAEPYAVAVDSDNNYYISDGANNRVAVYNPTMGTLENLAGMVGTAGYSNGVGVFARFWSPQGIVIAQGNVLIVADAGNHLIRQVTLAGVVTTIAGGPNAGTFDSVNAGFADGVYTNALFNAPAGLAVDPANANIIYIADTLNNAIRKLDLTSSNVTTVATDPYLLLRPSAVAVDGNNGRLYVADTGDHVIRVIQPNGALVATYGQVGVPGLVDSLSATQARFNGPRGLLWVDVSTGLLVSDTGNHVLRRIFINAPLGGLITAETYAKSDTAGLGSPAGLAKDALNNFPFLDLEKNSLMLIQRTTPQPPVSDPKIGVITVGTNFFGGPDPVLTPLINASFNNDVLVGIVAEDGVNTFYNYTTAGSLDDNTLTRTAPIYHDHVGPVPSSSLILLSGQPTTPYLIKARSTQTGRVPSAVVTAQYSFRVANPGIIGDNFNSFVLQDSTTNSELFYTFDGSTPIRGTPAIRAIDGDKISLPNLSSNIVFKVQAFKDGYAPSDVITKVFLLSDYKTTTIAVTNYSGVTNFHAGPGDTIIMPVQINPIQGDTIRSLQFRVEVTPYDTSTPAVPTNQIKNVTLTTNDFILVPLPSTNKPSVLVYTNFNAVTNSGVFTNSTPTNTGLAISYVGSDPSMSIAQSSIAAAVAVTIPGSAAHGQKYAITLLYPSATSDGRQSELAVKTITNNATIIVATNLSYVVGDSALARWYNVGDFGNTNLNNSDVNNAFYASLGLFVPDSSSDVFDAMDAFPVDTDTGVVGGDGQIRYLDWQVILKRSLRLPGFTANYSRGWGAAGRRVVTSTNFALGQFSQPSDIVTKSGSDSVWSRQALVGAQSMANVNPGQAVNVPVYVKVKAGFELKGLQFRAVVTPDGDAPALSQPAQFVQAANLPAQYRPTLNLPINQVVGAWDLSIIPALKDIQQIGFVKFTVPATAQAGQHYIVRFANADGAPNDSTQYDFETLPAYVWVGTAPLLPPEAISDEWKLKFFGRLNNPLADPNADPDGDGISNLQAYLQSVDPAKPRLHVLATEWQTLRQNGFKLQWFAAPGQNYVLERTDNPASGQWTTLSNETGQGSMSEVVDTVNATTKVQFYRVRRLPVQP